MRVLVAPDTSTAAEVLECLTTWSHAALLEPFCWWTTPAHGDAISMEVVRVERGEHHRCLLADALDGAAPEDVALVAFLPADPGEALDAGFAGATERCMAFADEVLAFSLDSVRECAMVVAPAAVGQPVPAGLFLARWSANVYVAPEDRVDPSDFNHLSGNRAAFPRHAAHAAASIADLWVGTAVKQGRVLNALVERQPSLAPAPVQVVRCFSRVLDYGYVVDHVAAGVFRTQSSWPNPDPRRFDRIADAENVLPAVAASFLQRHADVLGLSEVALLTLDPPEPLSLWEALRVLFRLIVERLRNRPFEIVENQVARLHDVAASRIEQMSGNAVLVRRYFESRDFAAGSVELAEALDRPFHVPDGPVAKTWSELRRLTTGIVDGGDLPPDIADNILARGSLRALVTDPRQIAVDPCDLPPTTEGEQRSRACDPLRVLEAREAAQEERGDAPGPEPSATQAASGAPPSDPQERCLLWLVGMGIAEALAQARRERVAPPPAEHPTPAERAAASARRRRRRMLAARALIGILALGGIGYLAWDNLEWLIRAPILLVLVMAWLAVLATVARGLLMLRDQEERELGQRQVDELNAAMKAAQRAGDAVRLRRRYDEFLDWAEILGWLAHRPWRAEALGRVDGASVLDPESMPAALQIGIARQPEKHLAQLVNQGRAQMFASGWLGSLYQAVEGRTMEAIALERVAAADGGGHERPDPASDVSQDPDSPRRKLLAAVEAGEGRGLDDNPLARDLLGMIDRMSLDALSPEVGVLRGDGEARATALPVALDWFEPPEDLQEISRAAYPLTVRVHCGARGLAGAVVDGRVVTARVPDADDEIEVTLCDGSRHATSAAFATAGLLLLDVGAPVDAHAAAADGSSNGAPADEAHEDESAGDDAADEARPRAGEDAAAPDLTDGFELAPAIAAAGEPVVAVIADDPGWGLVTGTEGRRQRVTFREPAGRAGTPIVDLDGRLVGVCGWTPVARRSRTAPPSNEVAMLGVDAIRRLLTGVDEDAPEEAARARRAGRPRPGPGSPTEFLAEPFREGSGMALLPQHWVDKRDAHVIEGVVPDPPDLDPTRADLGTLSPGAEFHRPLRVLVHRVDLTQPVPPNQLSSCRHGGQGS